MGNDKMFVEKNLGGGLGKRKRIFRQMDGASINDQPMVLHTLKSESLREQKEDELAS